MGGRYHVRRWRPYAALLRGLERASALKPERLFYARALERTAAQGLGVVDRLRAADGDELRRLVRELTKPVRRVGGA